MSEQTGAEVIELYRDEIKWANALIGGMSLDAAPRGGLTSSASSG